MTSPLPRLVRRLPAWVRRAPMDLLIIALCLQSGLVSLFGWGPTRALEAAMPWWAVRIWAICLLTGASCWLVGVTSIRERDWGIVASRTPVLLLGLHLLSITMPIYYVAIVAVSGWEALLPSWNLLLAGFLIAVERAELVRRRGLS